MSDKKVNDDFETFSEFVKQYPKFLKLAREYKQSPGKIMELLAMAGEEVLSRSNDLLVTEFTNKLKTFVSAKNIQLSESSLNALDSLSKFMREKTNEPKK